MSAVLSLQIYPFRAAAWIGWVLGLVAMALSVSGMYGVMTYLVNQRSKEIGIRMALGASPRGRGGDGDAPKLAAGGLGVLIGGVLAGGAVKLLLWWSPGLGVLVWDNFALLSGAVLAGGAAVLAALGPSSRAARVDPNTVLRATRRRAPLTSSISACPLTAAAPIRAATVRSVGYCPRLF